MRFSIPLYEVNLMAMPDFQSFMKPLLKYLSDGKTRNRREIYDAMAKYFKLTENEINEKLTSGQERRYENRVSWSITYFKQAKLVEIPKRGFIRITDRGLDVIRQNPPIINTKFLQSFQEFRDFQNRKKIKTVPIKPEEDDIHKTPQEYLEIGYQKINEELMSNLLNQISECSPQFFERLVVDLLLSMGYGGSRQEAGRVTRQTKDGGIDGIIKEDKLGLDEIYIQAKRWQSSVDRTEIQKFVGALAGKKAQKGIFITSSTFSKGAIEYAKGVQQKIILIDGEQLSELMILHNVGVTVNQTYEIKKLDLDYFIED